MTCSERKGDLPAYALVPFLSQIPHPRFTSLWLSFPSILGEGSCGIARFAAVLTCMLS
jgi:hypothetical protein